MFISITFHIKNNKKGIVRESFVRGNFLFSGVKNFIYRFLTPAVLLILFSSKNNIFGAVTCLLMLCSQRSKSDVSSFLDPPLACSG